LNGAPTTTPQRIGAIHRPTTTKLKRFALWLPGAAALGAMLLWLPSVMGAGAWERAAQTLTALIGLFALLSSVRVSDGRIRRVRLWVGLGFAAWFASQVNADLVALTARAIPDLSFAWLAILALAAAGAYRADLHGRVGWAAELAVYLDAVIVSAAASAILLVSFLGGGDASLLPTMVHAIVFVAIMAATLLLDVTVMAPLRPSGAYLLLGGIALVGIGFTWRSATGDSQAITWTANLISGGTIVAAIGGATWSDVPDTRRAYARVAGVLRDWISVGAVAAIFILVFARRPDTGPLLIAVDFATAVVLIGAVTRQTILLFQRAQLLRGANRWSEQLERIEALSRKLSRSRATDEVAEAVATEIASVIDWHGLRFYVLAADGETLEPIKLRSRVPHYQHETPALVRLSLGHGLGGHIAQSGVAELIPDAARDVRGAQIPGTESVDESMIVVPLVYEDSILGVLELFRLGLSAFDQADLRLAQIVGAQAAVALMNARQLEELERRLSSQRQLLTITDRLLAQRERGAVFEAIADTLAQVVPHDTLTIYLVDAAAGCLVPILARDEYAEQILATRPALGAGITGGVIARGEAEIVNDANNDPRVIHVPGTPQDEDEAMIVAPLRNPEGVIGALNLYRSGADFDENDLEIVRLFTNLAAIALENASVHDQLLHAAVTDPLTNLPNRRLFAERVDDALSDRRATQRKLAVLFLDLDRFKLVNDSLGHAAGDAVLQAVGERLRRATRSTDLVARLGGDEFGILLDAVNDPKQAVATSRRIIAALSEPIQVEGRRVVVSASIGIAFDSAHEPVSAGELLRDADTAMYRAKANTPGGFELFESSMHARQLARLELDAELRGAMEREELAVEYQPLVELRTGRTIGAEALLRWHHPTREISPQEFIKLAEESGQIVAIGSWVLEQACRAAAAWRRQQPDFRISVNISVRELSESSFVPGVRKALASAGLPSQALTLEITESLMLGEESIAIERLREVREMGVHVVVDDFGTGYSSLSYLQKLPTDGLKIDRMFISGLGSDERKNAIVDATIAFARALRLPVTAEGIETEEQYAHLVAAACDFGQGFLFAASMKPTDFTSRMQKEAMNSGAPSSERELAHSAGLPHHRQAVG
jgi:diguanylate cyclase (GGDEF)-like protein